MRFLETLRRRFPRSGFVDDERRAETPFVIDCDGLSRVNLPGEVFEREFQDRKMWCHEIAEDWEIEPIGPNPSQLTGRRFRFARERDAVAFKLTFPTRL
jgi:hypothetical protein